MAEIQYAKYIPRIKPRGFCPNPIAKYGIPKEADSVLNRNVIGTVAHEQFWEEQFHYLDVGYTTAGVWIPPRYYWWLNFWPVATVGRGLHLPDPIDCDMEKYETMYYAKKEGYGLIIPKKRRAGLSEQTGSDINCELRRRPEAYKAGIIAGLSKYSEEVMLKVLKGNPNLPPELRLNTLINTVDELKAGWVEKTEQGWIENGSQNSVIAKTVFNNPAVMKGSLLDDCYFEESGENKWLIEAYNAAKKCFYDGDRMIGTPVVYGTGGKISGGSGDFLEMWSEAEAYKLIRLRIYGDRKRKPFYVGATGSDGRVNHIVPNIMKLAVENNYDMTQIIGCEDTEHATMTILADQAEKLKMKNKKPYWESKQDDPIDDSDVFMKYGVNDYDAELLVKQKMKILSNPQLVNRYKLEWKTDPKTGVVVRPLQVKYSLIPEDENPDDWVWIDQLPIHGLRGAFKAGLDGYDIDKSNSSKSLGSMVVLGSAPHPKIVQGKPYALIRCRPKRKERFYELCAMLSVMYNLHQSVMADARSPLVIDWFIKNGFEGMLAPRPDAFDSINSEMNHKYGFKATTFTKPQMIALNQSWVVDSMESCNMLDIVRDFQDCDVEQTDSDWDSHDAVGLANICRICFPAIIHDDSEHEEYDPFELVKWERNSNGELFSDNAINLKQNMDYYGEEDSDYDNAYVVESLFHRNQLF